MDYIPSSIEERKQMLSFIGAKDSNDLFKDIPEDVRFKRDLKILGGVSEIEVMKHLSNLAGKNLSLDRTISFLGAGMYNHYVPAAVEEIVGRSEFYTSYTPYQAEASQGVLQALYEYQTMICDLTGMEVANASMYDGSSALAEACIMARNITGKKSIIVPDVLHPEYREVLRTYARMCGFNLSMVKCEGGSLSSTDFKDNITDDTAAVIVQNPNFFGIIEDYKKIKDATAGKNILTIACIIEATSLGLLRPPQEAEIVVGEGQSFGNHISFGGPHFGFMATKYEHVRKMPGRLVGATFDSDGRRGFVLTLQAREQHIRREKAASNICTSEALNAISAAVYLSLLGPKGLRKVAENSHRNACYLAKKLAAIKGFHRVHESAFYNEFAMKTPHDLGKKLVGKGIVGGLDLGTYYPDLKYNQLFCTTEVHSKEDLDYLVEIAKEAAK